MVSEMVGKLSCASLLSRASLDCANLEGVEAPDDAYGLDQVKSWRGAKSERNWVEKLGLDAGKLGLEVVDDVDDDQLAASQ